MKNLKDFITIRLGVGKHFFTKQEALSSLGISPSQFRFQAYRLAQKKVIKRLILDFYMIISPEFYHLGSLPPLWLIAPLMNYLGQEYYVGLLSAGSIYGATHQQPMTFQVIINKRIRNINLQRGSIGFHTYQGSKNAIKDTITVPTGYVQISSREQTMLDLVRFYQASGYLSNVAHVIKSLAEACDSSALEKAAKNEKATPVLQRLGYILEYTGFLKLSEVVAQELQKRVIKYVLLKPDFHVKEGQRAAPWKLIINDALEVE